MRPEGETRAEHIRRHAEAGEIQKALIAVAEAVQFFETPVKASKKCDKKAKKAA